MDKQTLLQFKQLFEEQKQQLVYTQGLVDENFHVSPDDMMDETDLTTAELEQSMRLRLRNRETLFVKKIDEALRRIHSGEFGQCESCEEQIDLKRLRARPTTTLCVSCKEEQERKEQFHADGRMYKSAGRAVNLRLA